jgi:hypothetical protein
LAVPEAGCTQIGPNSPGFATNRRDFKPAAVNTPDQFRALALRREGISDEGGALAGVGATGDLKSK